MCTTQHHRSLSPPAPLGSHLVEGLAVVNTDDRTDHLGHNDHVTQMRLHDCRLLVDGCLLLGLAQLLDQSQRLALQTARETPAGTAVHQLNQLVTILKSKRA